jgi:hypothetical protein
MITLSWWQWLVTATVTKTEHPLTSLSSLANLGSQLVKLQLRRQQNDIEQIHLTGPDCSFEIEINSNVATERASNYSPRKITSVPHTNESPG